MTREELIDIKHEIENDLQDLEAKKLMHEHKADECRKAIQRKQVEHDKICDKLYPKKR